MKSYINIHTHIFHLECIPRKFRGFKIPGFLYNRTLVKGLSRFLKILFPTGNDILDRYANFISVGAGKTHGDIYNDLRDAGKHLKMKYVVLSLDMDHMEAGEILSPYETQITHLRDLKKKFNQELLPFVSVDPRKKYPEGVRRYLENKFDLIDFVGIKIYPSLGYYPFHPGLEPVYEFACEHDLPVMTHCTRAGVWYQGEIRKEHVLPKNMNPKPIQKYDFSGQKKYKNRVFKDHFAKPENFVEVLEIEKFKNLKICFGHFGGSDEILKSDKPGHKTSDTNFYLNIRELMKNYPNVYTDISYSLSEIKKILPHIEADLRNPKLKNRIMFGTDFFLTLQEDTEKNLVDNCIKEMWFKDFNNIAKNNTYEYLTSKYYKP